MQYIAITGHRPVKLDNDYDLTGPLCIALREQIWEFIQRNFVKQDITFITGMALGIDTLFARMAISLNIPFIAAIPCLNHSSKWPPRSIDIYNYILSHDLCTIEIISQTPYDSTVMQKRNEWVVNHCNTLIAVWDGTPGGTANCVKYAEERIRSTNTAPINRIFYIDPNIIRKQLKTKPYHS